MSFLTREEKWRWVHSPGNITKRYLLKSLLEQLSIKYNNQDVSYDMHLRIKIPEKNQNHICSINI